MSMWYTFIMNAFFGKKRENKELEMNDKEDMLSNYIELDSLMQIIYPAKETGTDNLWGIKRSDLFVGRANDVKRFAVQ